MCRQALAERILYDKATMNTIFANDVPKRSRMRVAVGRIADTWFSKLDWEEGHILYKVTIYPTQA